MKVQEKKRKIAMSTKEFKIEREDHTKRSTTNQMVITSIHSGPSVQLTIITTFIIIIIYIC
jgi:hypothetical protein